MEDEGVYRRWDELIPDVLGLIFTNLSLQEKLTVVPRVCKSWCRAVSDPYCWHEIDIEEWSNQCHPDYIDRMLHMLIRRSSGSVRKLCVSGLHNDSIFLFLAEHAGSLQTLRLPRSEISDSIVEQIAGRLSTIKFLDLSYCGKIGACALEAIGEHCTSLVGLCRNMHPLDTYDKITQDDEAYAIANTMPKLKRLEIAYLLISSDVVSKILAGCPELEYLDLRGCWEVKLDVSFLKKFPKLKTLGPFVMDYYGMDDWDDDCSGFSYSSEYLPWEFFAGDVADYYDDDSYDEMWDDEQRLEELELRFYEGTEDAEFYGWYPSP
ncbi:hypothetical protein K2173_007919 [Erythroxylum novogranatense]|uniref:F-box domain-containing protein n=1 Tax=Erythroxylum novogranatense TaxID=1862640 RepID=A0AAV8T8D5_9ROSI|nr:hypothetical protein K2173_007919 [Erythroxylum novogranatense]